MLKHHEGLVGVVLMIFMVKMLCHESGSYDPNRVQDDVANTPSEKGRDQIRLIVIIIFGQILLFQKFVEREEKGVKYRNCNYICSIT